MNQPSTIAFLPARLLACMFAFLPLQAAASAAEVRGERPIAAKEIGLHAMLATLERQRAGAILRRDVAAMRQLMDRQYHHVDSRGRVRSKTELLTSLERDDFRFRFYEIESIEVQLLDGGKALVTGIFRTLQAGAPARPFRGRFAHLWVRQPDGWKNSFHQSTEIRPAQDDCACN